MNDIERAIETLKMENELMQFNLQNKDNQDLYKANLVAIYALQKIKYFRNCKECVCHEDKYNSKSGIFFTVCKRFDIVVDPILDGCSFYEETN